MTATRRMTVAQATVGFLRNQFSERDGERLRLVAGICGIFGHGNVPGMGQGLDEAGSDGSLPFVQVKNEQAMVHLAMGYAKAHRRLATLACTASIGPGSTNMLTGAATATVNRVPVLLFPSDYFAHRRTGVVLQQLEHPLERDLSVNDAFRPLSVFFDRVSRPEQLLVALPEAMRALTDQALAGAVTVALPQDVQGEALDVPERFLEPRVWRVRRAAPDPADVAEVAAAIAAARRPVVIAGGGVRYGAAEAALRAFAEAVGVPVAETFAGKGLMGNSDLCLGGHGLTGTSAAARIVGRADLVLCVGTRLTDFATASRSLFREDAAVVAVNLAAHDAHKLGALPVVADSRLALEALREALTTRGYRTEAAYRREVEAAVRDWWERYRADVGPRQGERMGQGEIVAALNAQAGPQDTVVAAAGTPPGEILKGWDNRAGSRCLLEFGFSCMGHEIPAAMGARLAGTLPGEHYAVVGDGTYLLGPTELVTACQHGLKVTVVLIDNSGFQCIRELQEATTGASFGNEFRVRDPAAGRPEGDYLAIDYVANAASMGCWTARAETPDELRRALAAARAQDRPAVIVCPADRRRSTIGPGLWWDLGVAEVSGKDAVRSIRAAHDQGRRAQAYRGP